MADSDGRDETGSSTGKTRVKDSQLEDHNHQQPAAIVNNPNGSREEEGEEEAREHQEAEPKLQETNRDAITGEEKEEINEEGAENPLLHGEMIKKRKADHEGGSGVPTLTLAAGDLPGAQTAGRAAMPIMMGRSGSEVGLGGGGVSISAAAGRRSVPIVYKCNYCAWTTIKPRAMGGHMKAHRYAVKGAVALAFASLDDQRAAAGRRPAEEDPPEADQEPPPRPAGQDEGGRDEENQKVVGRLDLNELPAAEAREHHHQQAPQPPPPSMIIISEPEAAASFHPPAPPVAAQASDNDHDGAGRRFDLNELPAVEDEDEQHAIIQPADNNAAAQPQEEEASGDDKDAGHHEPAEDSPAALD